MKGTMTRLVLLVFLLAARLAGASCVDTPNLGLQKCDFGDPNWDVFTNANWDKVDYSCTAPLTCAAGNPIALGTVGAANGGTGKTTYSKGDILLGTSGGSLDTLPVGANGLVLMADSGETLGVKFGSVVGTSLPVVDSLTLLKNSADGTKRAKFSLSGISTSTTRTFTLPDLDTTIATRTGSITTNHCAKFDANKQLVDAGDECGTGGGGGGTVYSGGSGSSNVSNSANSFFTISGVGYSTTSGHVATYVFPAGTWSSFGCKSSGTDTGGNGHTLTLVGCAATALTCNTTTSSSCDAGVATEDTGAGCSFNIRSEIIGTPTTGRSMSCSVTFTPS